MEFANVLVQMPGGSPGSTHGMAADKCIISKKFRKIINSFLNQQHQIWLTFNNYFPLKNAIFTSNMWDEQIYDTLPIDQVSGDLIQLSR